MSKDNKVWMEWNDFLRFLEKNRYLLPMPVTFSQESLEGMLSIEKELLSLRTRVEELSGQLCRARGFLSEAVIALDTTPELNVSLRKDIRQALSSPSPCRHEEMFVQAGEQCAESLALNVKLEQENATLREAVEKMPHYETCHSQDYIVVEERCNCYRKELRRRAGVKE